MDSRKERYGFTERTVLLKNIKIWIDTDLKIILLHYQNNYRMLKLVARMSKFFASLCSSALHNNYDNSTKLFSDLYIFVFSKIILFPCLNGDFTFPVNNFIF